MLMQEKGRLVGRQYITAKDKDGNDVKLWNNNKFGKFLLKQLRKFLPKIDPYVTKDNNGVVIEEFFQNKTYSMVRRIANHLHLYGLKIPYITGNLSNGIVLKNLIVDTGLSGAASRLGSNSNNPFTYLELGIGTTAAASGNTTLESIITDSGLARASATVSFETDSVANDTLVLTHTWTASGTKSVTECGALNAASAGILLGRQVFAAINMVSGMQLNIAYKFTIA